MPTFYVIKCRKVWDDGSPTEYSYDIVEVPDDQDAYGHDGPLYSYNGKMTRVGEFVECLDVIHGPTTKDDAEAFKREKEALRYHEQIRRLEGLDG